MKRLLPKNLMLPTIATFAFSYMTWHVYNTTQAVPPQSPLVPPARAPFGSSVAGAGLVEPRSENVRVGTLAPGVVSEVAVRVGQRVARGDLLFRIDDRQRRAELAIQESLLAVNRQQLLRQSSLPRAEDLPPLRARLKKAQSALAWQKDQLQRVEGLTARQVTPQQELIERRLSMETDLAEVEIAQTELDKLEAGAWRFDLDVSRTQVAQAEAAVAQAKTELDRLEVRSPIDATVLKVDVRPGEYVGTPPSQTLIVLGDVDVLHVRVDIDENDLPRFRPGMPGIALIRGDSLHPLELEFVRVEPFIEPKRSLTGRGDERIDTRVLQAIYALKPTTRTVFVGQQVDVFLDATESQSSSTAPINVE